MKKGEFFSVLEPIVKEAGALLKGYYLRVKERYKKDDGSFATEADLASEKFLIEHLKNVVPGAGFFAEESGIQKGNDFAWVIDPLDGTTNFAYGLPYFCVSVALTKNDVPIVGVIYQPLLEEFFYAEKGAGATLNGYAIKVSHTEQLEKSLIMFEHPDVNDDRFNHAIQKVSPMASSLRQCGAAALDLAYCASGRSDAVLLGNLSWWDVAAGMLLISEAGGIVSSFDGGGIGPSYTDFLGGNKLISSQLLPIVSQ